MGRIQRLTREEYTMKNDFNVLEEPTPLTTDAGAEARAIHEAFDSTGVTFHDRAATLAALKQNGRDVVFDNGVPHIVYDGELLELKEGLLRLAYDRRDLADRRTLPRAGAGTSRPGIDSKDRYKTTREKLDFISTYGAEAWERLPLRGPSTSEVLTREDFLRLPRQERMRRYAADPSVLAKLPSSSSRYIPGSAKVNVEGLQRHLASKGKLAR
jgi:hypothetical protein